MANQFMTLLDLAKLKGHDSTVGIFELGQKLVPEIATFPGRTIAGRDYTVPVRTNKPKSGFRKANEGVETGKSTFDFFPVQCYIADAQLEVDKAIADVHPFGRETFLADEMTAQTNSMFETISSQIYYGDDAGEEGFAGLQKFLTDADGAPLTDLMIDAGGSGGTSAYLVRLGLQGIHFVYGGNGSINDQEAWVKTKTTRGSKKLDIYENGLMFWIGLQLAPNSVVRIANIDPNTPANYLTDEMIADAADLFPDGYGPTHIITNKKGRLSLQKNRSANANRLGEDATLWAPTPVDSNDLPMMLTSGLVNNEAAVAF
jgi:hypothetical protein